ncbi:MAG: T9SS type A sorting domain-containing protein [Ignavibacteria bacterium]|nr:T9SS type A sorting domain-containing protein [Ignavibacteria bacterium]
MKKPNIKLVILLGTLLAFMFAFASAAEGPEKTKRVDTKQGLTKTSGTPLYQVLNINNIRTWARADGSSNHSPQGDDGGYYPRGAKWVIYQDGFVWGGKAYLNAALTQPHASQLIRVGGGTYNQGTREGAIVGTGAAAVPENRQLDLVRMFKIRRDYYTMSDVELTRDASDYYEIPISDVTESQKAAVKALYDLDWKQWPVSKGAPYIERNGTPGYQAPPAFSATFTVNNLISGNYDEPGFAGGDPSSPADQVIWTVYNDLEPAAVQGFAGSDPLGLEVQMTLWGYKRTDAMGNLYFKRFRFINKGGVTTTGTTKGSFWIDSMYVAQWSDPDVGSFGDDLAGCDTTLSLGYAYNGNAIDAEFRKFNLPPPAVGYDFLQGPIVRGAATDVGIFDMKKRTGFKNLPMTSFAYFSAGSGISDPPFSYEGGLRWWRMLQGYVPDASTAAWRLYPFPPGMTPNKFPLSGDPVRRTGFIDGLGQTFSFAPGDRRIVLNSGPFTLAPGDTQEVVVGTVAGLGSDRLSSIAVMKFNDRFVQNTYDALFQVAKAPAAPDVKIAELDGEVILEWGSNLDRVKLTEETISQPGAYKFEGYNIYQLPSSSSRLSEGTLVATYDLTTDPTVVLDEQFDQKSGQILQLPVQFGTNSGIVRYFQFKRDYVRDIDKLNNGQEYYYAVTAYSVATVPGFLPSALESDPLVFTARPKVPFGKVISISMGDTLKATKTGVSDGAVRPIVVNPLAGTGDTYEVTFKDAGGGSTTWSLTNKTKGKTVLTDQTNQSGDENYKLVEGGIFLKVEGPPPGMKDWDIPNGARRFTWADGWTGFEGFEGTIGWNEPAYYFGSIPERTVKAHELKNVLIKLAAASSGTATNPNAGNNPYGGWDVNNPGADPNFSYAYRFLRGATAAPARPEFAPYIVNATSGYPYQDYKRGVPFSAWDVEANPPVRLAVAIHENNVAAGLVDGKWWPPANGTGVTQSTVRDMVFIMNTPYTGATPDPAITSKNMLTQGLPIMYWLGVNRRGGADFSAGDEFLILANHVNTPTTKFTYTVPAPQAGAEVEKMSAGKVGVFPNPYYAFNAAETNRLVRFVTFNNLPQVATVRVFNLAGQLVRTLRKDDASQFLRWDLTNENNFPVASGMYIVHIELTFSDGSTSTKVLKLGVIQEQEVLDVF